MELEHAELCPRVWGGNPCDCGVEAARERIAALEAENELANLRVDAWHGNSDDWQAENTRLKDYITRRTRDQHVQCCVSHELVATWERDAALKEPGRRSQEGAADASATPQGS